MQETKSDVRIDKWLWAARFFKTRGLAQQAIENGRVQVDRHRVKPAHAVRVGMRILVVVGDTAREVDVMGLADKRGPAPVAQALYEETPESIRLREERAEHRRMAREPARAIHGRPTKRDRRELDEWSSFDGYRIERG